ncbi:hypothetical protein GW750_04010 [bacterium]|nr:hypothetical protein [bacterium]
MYTFLPKNLINDISSIVGFEQVSEEFYIATTQKDNFTTTVATQALSALDKRFARLGSR